MTKQHQVEETRWTKNRVTTATQKASSNRMPVRQKRTGILFLRTFELANTNLFKVRSVSGTWRSFPFFFMYIDQYSGNINCAYCDMILFLGSGV